MVSRPDRVGGDPLTLVSVCQSQPLPRTAGQCGAVLPPRPAPPRRPARAWNATRTCPAELGTLHITLIPCHRHRRGQPVKPPAGPRRRVKVAGLMVDRNEAT